jgi:hypothetical protein
MIKNKQARKTIAVFLLLNFLSSMFPYSVLYANNNGPNAPEASGFEPVNATDMVNLSSGDMAYVLPLLEVDGFPVSLSYHAGVPMEMDASWVGLGWNINTGAISRGVVSTPDDWKMGRSMKFTYYYYEAETYTINVGVGYGKAAGVGVGLSWGSNKSLSGSVSASIGPISASIDTDGNYSVGLDSSVIGESLGFKDVFGKPESGGKGTSFGGSLSVSGNTSGGGLTAGASAGITSNGLTAGMGVSISNSGVGVGYSIGKGNSNTGTSKRSSGMGGSIGSFSAGDLSIASSGFYLPITIGIFSFGFGYQKQKISYKKGLNRYGFGSLYQSKDAQFDVFETNLGESRDNNNYYGQLLDHQRRNFYGDIYDQELPRSELEFIKDYRTAVEKVNFTFAGYDNYGVNASGITGSLAPVVAENNVLIGEGFEGANSERDTHRTKMKVFYHNAVVAGNSTLAASKAIDKGNLNFAFKGHISNNVNTSGYLNNPSKTHGLTLADFAAKGSTLNEKLKTGSFVEVFTNKQLDQSSNGLLLTTKLYNKGQAVLKRTADLGYEPNGIGGYKITAPDGKTYHFAQPVYQYEKIEHSYINVGEDAINPSSLNSTAKRSATPYATHWLLTAITGPDFIDNGNNFPDRGDLGYWVRLDHGQWSNAYAWRTPYAGTGLPDLTNHVNSITVPRKYRSYATHKEENIDKADAGHFMQGRKDLYYLDKIVTRNQIAYFVKDLRKDGLGTDLDYVFTDAENDKVRQEILPMLNTGILGFFMKQGDLDKIKIDHNVKGTFANETVYGQERAKYEKEYLLKLNQIIIAKNTGDNGIKEDTGTSLAGISPRSLSGDRYRHLGYFNRFLPVASQTHSLHQVKNVLDVNDVKNYDYSKALKVIKFEHDYSLAKNSPNSSATTKGRLTLNKLKFYGRGTVAGAKENQLFDYMPPYEFSYKVKNDSKNKEVVFSRNDIPSSTNEELKRNKIDSWGFIEGTDIDGNTLADTWSLNKIKTPEGSEIAIDYEEDDFYVEAFSRRYWDNNLKFLVKKQAGSDDLILEVYNDNNKEQIDFTHYFRKNEMAFLDFWMSLGDRPWYGSCFCSHSTVVNLDIKANEFEVVDVLPNKVSLKIDKSKYRYWHWNPGATSFRKIVNVPSFISKAHELSGFSQYKHQKVDLPRGTQVALGAKDEAKFSLLFKLLANRAPQGKSGGGLKVTKITVKDDAGAKFETTYDYRKPDKKNGGFLNQSSGITSFFPVYGTTFVPYQNELPGPGVMYEWVTMKARGYDASGKELPAESTRYHYYTLQPNFAIFDPNFTMTDNDGEVLFKATVKNAAIDKAGVKAKDIHLEKNLGKIGQLISIEKFNSKGHLMNKTTNSYTQKQGQLKEVFTSMKSIYKYHYNKDNEFVDIQLKGRALSKSSKTEKEQVLNKITTITPYGSSSISYSNPDPYLGSFRTTVKKMADGTEVKETKVPAYSVYHQMGSKSVNLANKNMLTQEAMHTTAVKVKEGESSTWRTTQAKVTTWNKDWTYRDENGVESRPSSSSAQIWRKHKNYIWKGSIDALGTYGRELSSVDFSWGFGQPQSNKEWQSVSEITRYTPYSLPVETKDINGNYASTKMAANFSDVIATGNAKQTELYYSGLEYTSGNAILKSEDEFTFENTSVTTTSHTGKKAAVVTANSKAFKLQFDTLDNSVLTGKKMRPGTYKVSHWLFTPSTSGSGATANKTTVRLKFGTQFILPTTTVKAGDWTLMNYAVNVPDNSTLTMYLTNEGLSTSGIVDDFRVHPIASTMNAYVYDKVTNELRYILNANNLASEFRYDGAGRLCKAYTEVVDQGSNKGGFKLVSTYRYNYKNQTNNAANCGCCND